MSKPGYKVLRQGAIHQAFAGAIREGRKVVWECGHSHVMKHQAKGCASRQAAIAKAEGKS